MVKNVLKEFTPDWVAPPGWTIKEKLKYIGMSQKEFSYRIGMHKENINEILNGKTVISYDTALKIETVLGIEANYLLKLENNYRIHLARIKKEKNLIKEYDFIKKFPIKEMQKRGLIRDIKNKQKLVLEVKKFLRLEKIQNLQTVYVNFRKSDKHKINEESLIVWIIQAEKEAMNIDTKPFNKKRLKAKIKLFRKYTNKQFSDVFEILRKELKECGVALVYVPIFKGVPVFGAVKWLGREKLMMTMSLRYKTNDIFWFTFYHEIYHILSQNKKNTFIDWEKGQKDKQEIKADNFARRTLIPLREYNYFLKSTPIITKEKIKKFAEKINIAPGIVVGRLQYDRKIPYNKFNELKIKY